MEGRAEHDVISLKLSCLFNMVKLWRGGVNIEKNFGIRDDERNLFEIFLIVTLALSHSYYGINDTY